MAEDRFGVSGRITERRKRLAARLNRRNRRLLAAGLPLMAIAAAALPTVISHVTAKDAASARPSRTLCTGWARCTRHGYPSYHYQTRGFRSYWRMSAGDQCTNYTAYVESTVYHVPEPSFLLGNGGEWAATAAAHGVKVNHTPSVGAVAEWDGGAVGMSSAGHVAVVEAVGPHHRYIVISQQHIGGQRNDYDWTRIWAHRSTSMWQTWPSHFIHFRIPRRADVGYYNRWTGKVSERYSQTSGPVNAKPRIGRGKIPLVGDWRGNGRDRLGYYNPRYGTFRLFGAGRGRHSTKTFKFGPRHMIPLVGDWTGAGHDGIGYYNPKTGTFYLREKLSGGKALKKFRFGPRHMIPLAGHWTGGRRSGVGYYNPKKGLFALRNKLSAGPPFRKFKFGPKHMVPLAGSWNGKRWDGVGYYNRWKGTFHLRKSLGKHRASVTVRFGPRKMVPLT
ncbi:MAG TPA: CHAP domain-containing protein, partial [Streptosporangiaceae bacterium]|nr:CHAP domain-containing protein [Streptosporangiaceae bacterium]